MAILNDIYQSCNHGWYIVYLRLFEITRLDTYIHIQKTESGLKQLKMENTDYDGSNYIRDLDKVRLAGQMKSIFLVMKDAEWRTLNEIAEITGFGEASISAQLRNLRKAKFGSHIVDKRRRGEKNKGLWEYCLYANEIPVQGKLKFRKGDVPASKGIKGVHNSPATEFKPGIIPANIKPVGSITIRNNFKRGSKYYYIKLLDGTWRELHLYKWEKKHGSVPKGKILVFKDRDTMNIEDDNLELITRAENADRNRDGKLASVSLKETWRREKLRILYDLPQQTKLHISKSASYKRSRCRQLAIIFPITVKDICTMCHWSSGCDNCCVKCKNQCNSGQTCSLNDKFENLQSRWEAWNLIKQKEAFGN